jgi:Na+-translocating ferredoxin:NAD+ oxidoreductase RNF subunit RnfB
MSQNDVYTDLAKKLQAPLSKRFMAILEAMFTPDEARICLELFLPDTCKEVASRTGMDEKDVAKSLDNLVAKGLLTRGKTQFAFHTNLLGLHHDVADTGVHAGSHAISQKVKDLWADFFYNEWAELWVKQASDRKKAGVHGIMLTPAIGALELSPNIKPEQILPGENWKMQIKAAKRRIVAPCGCRTLWGKCTHPVMTCFACFDNSRGVYYLDKPGRLLKEISEEETLQIVRKNEEIGLIHWGVCYCCPDACEMLHSYTKYNRLDLVEPNRYLAVVDEDLCTGCQVCLKRCPFNAIEMRPVPGSKKQKAYIINDNCKGCGVCIVGCKQKAMHYELVKPAEWFNERQMRIPTGPPVELGKGRKIPVGAYGGFYELD